jgi:glycosyltransferase involved in cell wall biosynthesis
MEQCKAVVTCSRGLVQHFRQFLATDVWHKLEFAFPAFPSQPEIEGSSDGVFTFLMVGNRFSDKGFPEALRAFEVLRERHGSRVRVLLVSKKIPPRYRLPEGVEVYDTPRMSSELKATIYRSADVLLVPAYTDTVGNFPEACAFGVPVVSTRMHHDGDFVRDGESGYLIDAPLFAYSEEYGTRWRSWKEFLADVEAMRESGELDGVVDALVDRLEPMVSGDVDVDELRRGARRLHAERFSPEARNAKLHEIYARALRR